MWIRTAPGELVNLDHSHHIHVVECGAPKFQVEVIAMIGSERYILAYLPNNPQAKQLAADYIACISQAMQRSNKLVSAPMYPRHSNQSAACR